MAPGITAVTIIVHDGHQNAFVAATVHQRCVTTVWHKLRIIVLAVADSELVVFIITGLFTFIFFDSLILICILSTYV